MLSMKPTLLFGLTFILILGMISCDKIDNPQLPTLGLDLNLFPGEPEDYPFPILEGNSNPLKNVLLEDYTGHKCVPCVAAAEVAKEIEDDNLGRVHVVSIHASPSGNFQQTDDEHPTDFTTESGDTYVIEMDGLDFNPVGTINRTLDEQSLGQSSIWQVVTYWDANSTLQLDTDLDIDLQVVTNYFSETNGLFIHSRADVLNQVEGNFNLVHYLVRKEVEAAQTTTSGVDEEYGHHNVLSDNIGGAWGVNVFSGNSISGLNIENQVSFELPDPNGDPTYEADNLLLFSYIVNRDTYEILQVRRTEVN